MKLLALEIEGYGVWNGLKLQRMSEGINVVYGPNEAGKSTVLHFICAALYGFSPERRRYLPPKHGGRPGGSMEVAGAGGQFQIARYASTDGNPRLDELHVAAADGVRQGEQTVKTLLANIDEPTFRHVFAVSLSEMQELATLTDTQAAEMLYSITAGLDRVSLIEVMNELDASRARILDQHGGEMPGDAVCASGRPGCTADRGATFADARLRTAAGRSRRNRTRSWPSLTTRKRHWKKSSTCTSWPWASAIVGAAHGR